MVLPMRLQQLGHIVEIAHHRGGRAGALAVVRRRTGRHFDPRLAKVFVEEQVPIFEAIEDRHIFERFLRLEPEPVASADERRMEDVARALAIFSDIKSPIFLAHSTGVAALAKNLGFSADQVVGFGDAENDIPLFDWAGTSVAMPHGWSKAIERASMVAPTGPIETALARGIDLLFAGR